MSECLNVLPAEALAKVVVNRVMLHLHVEFTVSNFVTIFIHNQYICLILDFNFKKISDDKRGSKKQDNRTYQYSKRA
jgi:predicted transport protein